MVLRYETIHACPNDCIVYRDEFESLKSCPKCCVSRYKGRERVPAKVLLIFPRIPTFRRLHSTPWRAPNEDDMLQNEKVIKDQTFLKDKDKKVPEEFYLTYPNSPFSQTSSARKYTITHDDNIKVTTNLLQVFKDVSIGMKNNGKIKSFTIPSRVFQIEQCVSLDYEDMLDWCFQRKIGSSHMTILMMYLSDMVHSEGISGLYGFCDSNYLSPLTPTENEDDRSNYLCRVFACNNAENKNQIFLAPYHEGLHWMLAVIYPCVGLVYWLDPAGVENEPREFAQKIINKGIIKFSMERTKDITKMKKNSYIKWKSIECPRQRLGTNDCGYYVCRYMIEIIESRQLIPDKYFDKAPSTYSQQMIDELRELWISYVSGNDQQCDDDDDDDDDIFEL